MIEDTTPRPDTVTISADEYADLVRAAAMLDAIVIMAGGKNSRNPLMPASQMSEILLSKEWRPKYGRY